MKQSNIICTCIIFALDFDGAFDFDKSREAETLPDILCAFTQRTLEKWLLTEDHNYHCLVWVNSIILSMNVSVK